MQFRWDVLRLALAASFEPWSSMSIEDTGPATVTQGRVELQLQTGEVDVGGFGVTAQRVAHLRHIRFDLLKGLIGLRFMIVRREDRPRFARMSDQDIVHAVHYGTQQQWADVAIMRANNMQLQLASSSQTLYQMLASGRFDALSRGANEVLAELKMNADIASQLAIEPVHALYYDYPIWFWVRPGNEALARAIETGMRNILRDGSFHALFLEKNRAEIEFVRRCRQRVLRLSSSALPQPIESPDTSWWWPLTLPLGKAK